MAAHLKINGLSVVTPQNRFEYAFSSGINSIVGEVGSGKSSLLELVKYALGGGGVLTPAVQAGVRRVVLRAELGEERVILEREIGDGMVHVLEADGTLAERVSTRPRKDFRTASAFLLDALGLPELRVTNARPTKKSQPISFYDVYGYCYVSQAEIDRSVVGHLDPLRRSKRVGTFELLMGLTDDVVSSARVRLGQLGDELAEAKQPVETIDRFMAAAEAPTEEQLFHRRSEATETLAHARSELEKLRLASLSVTARSANLRSTLAVTLRESKEITFRIRELEEALAARRQLAAELDSDEARLGRATAAHDVLGSIEFVQCPRCMQAVGSHRASDQQCYLCMQPEPPPDAGQTDTAELSERRRIASLRAELEELDSDDLAELNRLRVDQDRYTMVLAEIERELDHQTHEFVSPRYEAIEDASASAARAQVELEESEHLLRLWAERSLAHERVARLRSAIEEVEREIQVASNRLAARRHRIVELSEIFDEVIRELKMPWYDEGSYIDSRTYLPVVNGVSLEDLGSGGMKMMTNVAYHLAILTYGLSEGLRTIPNLLIIDSPRKNLGTTEEDQAHANAFYRWISALTGAYEGQFQIVIADNDRPPSDTPISTSIELSHRAPLVKDLEHPGGAVETIGSS